MNDFRPLISLWRNDPGGTYQTWFLWKDRIRNFGSIKRGLTGVVRDIKADTFGNLYKGSTLEPVVKSIAEHKQIFKGADHAFLWKPKLRIPDIYESRDNQQAFGFFLDTCCSCSEEHHVLAAIKKLDQQKIKGLGPAVANLLYFVHPTIAPPCNTAIVKGFNKLFGAKVKLGSWSEYLAMREGILRLNEQHRSLFSNDLGAVAGLLFDIAGGRYDSHLSSPSDIDSVEWKADVARLREAATQSAVQEEDARIEHTHSDIQGKLRNLGHALGYDVWIASNDRSRSFLNGSLGDGCLTSLPPALESITGGETIRLIDVLWLEKGNRAPVAAFEVEHSTSIYSGVVRMLDLALGFKESACPIGLFLVAPDSRQEEVHAQLRRPAFRDARGASFFFIPYGSLGKNLEAMSKFGQGLKAVEAIAQRLNP
jgi:type II restriction enzyme